MRVVLWCMVVVGLVLSGTMAWRARGDAENTRVLLQVRDMLLRLTRDTEVDQMTSMTAVHKYQSGGNEIIVTTTQGVPGPGETVDPNESLPDWATRHRARIAASKHPDVFPED